MGDYHDDYNERNDGAISLRDRLRRMERKQDVFDEKLDKLDNKVTYIFGGFSTIAIVLALIEFFSHH